MTLDKAEQEGKNKNLNNPIEKVQETDKKTGQAETASPSESNFRMILFQSGLTLTVIAFLPSPFLLLIKPILALI